MSEKGRNVFTAQVFGESLESLEQTTSDTGDMPVSLDQEMLDESTKNTDENISETLNGTHFTPHPPERSKDSPHQSARGVKNKRHFYNRRVNRIDPNSQSSDDEKLVDRKEVVDLRTTGSKLPPLSNDLSDEIGTSLNNNTITPVHKNLKQTQFSLNLKPLSPIKNGQNVAEDFKAKQSLERGRHEIKERGPIKPLNPPSGLADSSEQTKTGDIDKSDENKSESTLTSVSEDDFSDIDSDSELSSENNTNTQHYPHPPNNRRDNYNRSNLSLNAVKDYPEQVDRHSDTEAIRRGRTNNRSSSKELWKKARVTTLLPRVPASRARDRTSNFVNDELEKYLPERKLMVFVGTWNMHGEKQLPVFVDDFLLPECCQFMQDLYVIGSQESTPMRKEWEIKLQEALGPSHVLIYSCTFGVLHLAMYLRRELVWFCSAVEQATVATRPGHMIKTKGAVGLSLSIFGTSFLFINSHFTAHEQKWRERISDYRLIRKTLSLPLNCAETTNHATDVTSRFNQVFWFGDFNFRVEERHGVVEKFLMQCEEDDYPSYEELVSKDQMTRLMKKDNSVFEHFKEAKINFPPTYRFDINPDDPGHYSSIRVPSWTDRIIYRSTEENGVVPLHYDCCTTLNISDHRPVYGIFEATIKPIKDRLSFTGVHFVRDVYIEANRRRATPPRNQNQTAVCIIL